MTPQNTVLVVDDDERIRKLIKFNLARKGHNVLQAANGKEGLDIAKKERPDLIISDITIPNVSGLEFCREVKSSEQLKNTVFILLIGKHVEDHWIDGIVEDPEITADDFLTKPFNGRELIARVDAGLRTKNLQTDLSNAVKRIQETQSRFARASRQKTIFKLALGFVHEVRNIIIDNRELVQVANLKRNDATLEKLFRNIRENSKWAMLIINDILAFTRIDDMKMENFPITRALDDALLLVENSFGKESITVEKNYMNTAIVYGNLAGLKRVFLNLLRKTRDNMTEDGSITICVRENDDHVIVDLTDTSWRISEKHPDRIFEPFFTITGNLAGGQTSQGFIDLGLLMSYNIMEHHGGTMWVSSAIGEGSAFLVIIPKSKKPQYSESEHHEKVKKVTPTMKILQ